MYWWTVRSPGDWMIWVDDTTTFIPDKKVVGEELKITLINHATVLIQTGGVNILTDPVFSDWITPVPGIGTKRSRPPGVNFENLPPIDIVLISHNHYDHMDIPTLEMLNEHHKPLFVVPLGNKELLEDNEIKNVIELDWWQDIDYYNKNNKDMKITFVPARHFSMRGLCDRDATLWGGYIVHSDGGPVYFAGDTGYGKHFKMIREKYGPARVALLPLGPINPRWFMKPMHIDPAEAVQAHLDLESQKSIGIHFGTFRQADDDQAEPFRSLLNALEIKGLSMSEFAMPRPGRSISIPTIRYK